MGSELVEQMCLGDFEPSDGWVDVLLKRHHGKPQEFVY